MNSELFSRLKKISTTEGMVVIVEDNEAFVLMPLEEYEDFKDGECECDLCLCDGDKEEEITIKDEIEEAGVTSDDKELLKKVNEDIAKWRAEQEQPPAFQIAEKPFGFVASEDTAGRQEHKNIETKKHENQEQEENISKISDINSEKPSNLEEEERYYLEPLE